MELSRIFRRIFDDTRVSTVLLVGIGLTVAALTLGVPRQRGQTAQPTATGGERALMEILGEGLAATSQPIESTAAASCCVRPSLGPSRAGTQDLPDVPAFPGAQRVENRTTLDGYMDQVDYHSLQPPSAVITYYFGHLTEMGWQVERMQPLDSGGHGWWAVFRSDDLAEVVIIYASTEWLDLPPGGERNMTYITVSRTNWSKEVERAWSQGSVQTTSTPAP